MRALMAFTKKEWLESIAHYRLLIVLGLFFALGIMNVFIAKFTPQLISQLVSEEVAKGFPEPTVMDVWLQFFKNTTQMGLVVTIILFSGILTQEYQKETLTILLTKGLSRWKVIIGKLIASCLLFTLGYWLSVGVTYLYAWLYFEQGSVLNIWFALFMLWLFGLFFLMVSLLGGILFRQNYGVLLFTSSLFGGLLAINLLPDAQKYNPIRLINNSALLAGTVNVTDFYPAIGVTVVIGVIMLSVGILRFNKKAL
ncbi:ABC transporter permease subunit [Vagococcus sp. BWB3-3]|uniref:ABC transporter permease subunit n=1 Tax=Vagococcus allomyrinae TaxID=2794353 RepID=A0A940PC35_9ENTE|nr:ABC transporter permease subunit [Vagococcus allomyrinae]MBP1041792.1 ABC transporter permease subunit [Vagococcus allomyrinae]